MRDREREVKNNLTKLGVKIDELTGDGAYGGAKVTIGGGQFYPPTVVVVARRRPQPRRRGPRRPLRPGLEPADGRAGELLPCIRPRLHATLNPAAPRVPDL